MNASKLLISLCAVIGFVSSHTGCVTPVIPISKNAGKPVQTSLRYDGHYKDIKGQRLLVARTMERDDVEFTICRDEPGGEVFFKGIVTQPMTGREYIVTNTISHAEETIAFRHLDTNIITIVRFGVPVIEPAVFIRQ